MELSFGADTIYPLEWRVRNEHGEVVALCYVEEDAERIAERCGWTCEPCPESE